MLIGGRINIKYEEICLLFIYLFITEAVFDNALTFMIAFIISFYHNLMPCDRCSRENKVLDNKTSGFRNTLTVPLTVIKLKSESSRANHQFRL